MKPHKHAELIKAHIHRFFYEDGELKWKENYGPRARKGCIVGSADSSGYLQVKLGKPVLVHRIIWFMFNNDLPDQIDHIDRNRMNNRIENLRASNNMKNQHNSSVRKDNKTGCPGVNVNTNGKYQARISVNGKRINLGSHVNLKNAVDAYIAAKEIYHAQA